MKKLVFYLIALLNLLLLTNCKEAKDDNCIIDMHVEYISENPGPDVVSFKIISNYEPLRLNLESFESIELSFNDIDVYRASAQFELEKVSRNEYMLT